MKLHCIILSKTLALFDLQSPVTGQTHNPVGFVTNYDLVIRVGYFILDFINNAIEDLLSEVFESVLKVIGVN